MLESRAAGFLERVFLPFVGMLESRAAGSLERVFLPFVGMLESRALTIAARKRKLQNRDATMALRLTFQVARRKFWASGSGTLRQCKLMWTLWQLPTKACVEEGCHEQKAAPVRKARVKKAGAVLAAQRPTRWGRCLKCQSARRPWVYRSGSLAGVPVLVCSRLFSKAAKCFQHARVSRTQLRSFPLSIREQHKSLHTRLKRGGRFENEGCILTQAGC